MNLLFSVSLRFIFVFLTLGLNLIHTFWFCCDTKSCKQWCDLSYCWVGTWEACNLGNFQLDFVCSLQLHICFIGITNWLAVWLCVFTDSGPWVREINICVDMAVSTTDRLKYQEGMVLFLLGGLLGNTDCNPGKWQSLIWKWGEGR